MLLAVDPTRSSTFVDLDVAFSISYGDGTGASGEYFNDTLTLSSATLDNFQMAVATKTSTNTGLIGIGYDSNESGVSNDLVVEHYGFVDALVGGGYISTRAYSLWLDDYRKSSWRE